MAVRVRWCISFCVFPCSFFLLFVGVRVLHLVFLLAFGVFVCIWCFYLRFLAFPCLSCCCFGLYLENEEKPKKNQKKVRKPNHCASLSLTVVFNVFLIKKSACVLK